MKKEIIKELWSLQALQKSDLDAHAWNQKRSLLFDFSQFHTSCLFTVDVFRECYDFLSPNFAGRFGFKPEWIRKVSQQGDILEAHIHPDDREQIQDYQIEHGQFLQTLPPDCRNDFQQTFRFRMHNGRYLNGRPVYTEVTSSQQVLQTDCNGKAWIILGVLDCLPTGDTPFQGVKRHLLHRKTGEILTRPLPLQGLPLLSKREQEVLSLVRQGFLSKEIANKLRISLFTVHNHRKQILSKLHANNSIEAIRHARQLGLID